MAVDYVASYRRALEQYREAYPVYYHIMRDYLRMAETVCREIAPGSSDPIRDCSVALCRGIEKDLNRRYGRPIDLTAALAGLAIDDPDADVIGDLIEPCSIMVGYCLAKAGYSEDEIHNGRRIGSKSVRSKPKSKGKTKGRR